MLGAEYLTSNQGTAYPFKEDAAALSRDGTVLGPKLYIDAIVDAILVLPAGYTGHCLKSIQGTATLSIVITEFTDTETWTLSATSPLNAALTWQTLHFTTNASPARCTLVVDPQRLIQYMGAVGGSVQFGHQLPFEASTVLDRCDRLDYLGVTQLPIDEWLDGRVKLQGGYNVGLTVLPPTDVNAFTTIKIDAAPGAGEGQYPCDAQPAPAVAPNNLPVQSDTAGNITLEAGDDCYAIVPHPDLNTFEIQGVCQPCCSCQDYENVLAAMAKLKDKLQLIYSNLTDAHNGPVGYTYGVQVFNASIAPKVTTPQLFVNGMRGCSYIGVGAKRRGSPNFVTFVASLKNLYRGPVKIVSITPSLVATINGVPHPSDPVYRAWEYNQQGAQGWPAVDFQIGRSKQLQMLDCYVIPYSIADDPARYLYTYNLTVQVSTLDDSQKWILPTPAAPVVIR